MKTLTILLAGLAALCAVPAVAEPVSVPVSFAGLDLSSDSGQAILNRRINQAAKMVCGAYSADGLAAKMAANKCLSTTLDNARTRVAIAIASSKPAVQTAAR